EGPSLRTLRHSILLEEIAGHRVAIGWPQERAEHRLCPPRRIHLIRHHARTFSGHVSPRHKLSAADFASLSARTPALVGQKYRRARPPRIAVPGASLEEANPFASSRSNVA